MQEIFNVAGIKSLFKLHFLESRQKLAPGAFIDMNASDYLSHQKTNVFLTQDIKENTENGSPCPLIAEQAGTVNLKTVHSVKRVSITLSE